MSYRGEDLDLRTQPAAGAVAKEAPGEQDGGAGQRGGLRNDPIWVDNTVLACANHAFDVAFAHRAGEVRLEHFLHAMTRIDAAAEALEARGVRVAALRRESATIIASEIPMALGGSKGAPRRSEEFADVLRMASQVAARRNASATIDDVCNVLFDPRTDVPALSLLVRHTLRPHVREALEQFPPLSRYPGETRYAPPERYARAAPEAMRYAPEPSRIYRTEYSGTDAVQNSRIEALEQMVRSLSDDLAGERHLVAGMLRDLAKDLQAQRDDQGRMHSGLYERIQGLETAISESWGTAGAEGLVDQLLNLEVALEQRLKEFGEGGATLSNRISELEAALKSQDGDRLAALEGEIGRAVAANAASTDRLENLISGLEGQREAIAAPILDAQKTSMAELMERLNAVERALAAEIETAAAKHRAYAQGLGEVQEALMKINQNQHTLAGSIDQWRTDAASDIATIMNRLSSLERDNAEPVALLHRVSAHMDNMNKVMVERYHRRHRFWYWLFGTDDWLGASWPSQTAAIQSDRSSTKVEETAAE